VASKMGLAGIRSTVIVRSWGIVIRGIAGKRERARNDRAWLAAKGSPARVIPAKGRGALPQRRCPGTTDQAVAEVRSTASCFGKPRAYAENPPYGRKPSCC